MSRKIQEIANEGFGTTIEIKGHDEYIKAFRALGAFYPIVAGSAFLKTKQPLSNLYGQLFELLKHS